MQLPAAVALACLGCLITAPVASAEFPFGLTQRTSFMGRDGDPAFSAGNPDVAYDSGRDRYMVVWQGQEPGPDGPEIYGKRISRKHERIEPGFKLSDTPGTFVSGDPTITFNPALDEFLVLWDAKHSSTGAKEIYGQRVTPGGNEIGPDFLVSTPRLGAAFDASVPKLAYNASSGNYLAVWQAHDEIYGRMLSATGTVLGQVFRISPTRPSGSPIFGARDPSVAYDSVNHSFLVAWSSDDAGPGGREIYTSLYAGDDIGGMAPTGPTRISHMGPEGDKAFAALEPSLAFNPAVGEYLLVWRGDATVPHGQYEVYAQRLNAANGEVGATDFRVSDMGRSDGTAAYAVGERPTVEYLSVPNRYLVLWHGDDDTPPLVDGEIEVFGQALDAGGQEVGVNDFPVTSFGPKGSTTARAEFPKAAYNPQANQTLVVWQGTGAAPLASTESEIFSRRVGDDRDGDGVIDGEDLCPTVSRGPFDADGDGCADDRDADGILDEGDRCPSVGRGAFDANGDGCPDDSDGDGVLDERDLCRAIPGGRLDTNRNGCPGPFESLAGVRLSTSVVVFRRYIVVDLLKFRDLPKTKVTIRLRCNRGCAIKETLIKKVGRRSISSRRFKHRRLRSGAIITATITAKDMIGSVRKYKVKGGDLRQISKACIPIGSSRARKTCDQGR